VTLLEAVGTPAAADPATELRVEDQVDTKAGRLAGNAFWTLAGHLAGKGAGFAFVVIVARGLGAREYGAFNFALSFVALFLLAGSYAIEPAVIREVARSRERLSEVFASGLLLRGTLAVAAFGLAVLFSPFLVEGGRSLAVVAILGVALCLDELTTYAGSVYKAFERVALHGLAIVTNRVLSTLLAVVALAFGGDIVAVSLAYLVGSLGAFGFAWIGLRRYFPPIELRAIRRPVVRELLVDGVPMAMAGVFNAALFRIDMVLLVAIKGPLAGGFYGVAYRFFDTFLFLSWSLTDVTLPRMARAGRGAAAGHIFQLGAAVALAFLLPLAVIAPFAAEWAVTTVFSDSFRPAAFAVPWLAAAGVFYSVAYSARVSSVALRQARTVVWIAAVVLATNVAVNLAVIPRYGFRGAAVASCLSEALEAALLLWTFIRANGGLYLRRAVFVPLAAASAALAVLLITGARDGSGAVAGLLSYALALPGAAWLLAREETRSFRHLLRSRTSALGQN
jgi:O-antigen/teichoic acid export membrane protein